MNSEHRHTADYRAISHLDDAMRRYRQAATDAQPSLQALAALTAQACGASQLALCLLYDRQAWPIAQLGLDDEALGRLGEHLPPLEDDQPRRLDDTSQPPMTLLAARLADAPARIAIAVGGTDAEDERLTSSLRAALQQAADTLELACLRRHQGQERRILESAVDYAIVATDLAGCVTSWNSGAERILGWSSEEMTGQALARIFTESDCDRRVPQQEMARALQGGSALDERWHRRKDGSRFWANGEMMLLRDDDGNPQGFLKILRDRTDIHREQTAAREAEERYRMLVDLSPQVVALFDARGAATYVNAYWCDYTGLDVAASLDTGWRQAIVADERETVVRRFEAAIAANVPFTLEIPLRSADGETRWFQQRGVPQFDAEARVLRWIVVALDIDARRRAEADRLESEAFTRVLVDSASEGFYSIDTTGMVTLCNDAFVNMLGFASKDDVLGRRLHDVIHHSHPDGRPYLIEDCPINRTAVTGQPVHVEYELFYRLDGTSLPVEYRVGPIYRDGELKGAICTFTDISERVRGEALQAFLLELSDRLQVAPEPGNVSGFLCERLGPLLGTEHVGYGVLDETGALRIDHEWQRAPTASILGTHPLEGTGLAEPLLRGALLPVQDLLANDDSPGARHLHESLASRGLLLAPLLEAPERRSLLLFSCTQPRRWRVAELGLVREVIERVRAAQDRARADRALREAEQRVILANEIASIGVWEFNATRRTLHWDAQLKVMSGLAAEAPELGVDAFAERIHPDDREMVIGSLRRALSDEKGEINLEYRIRDSRTGQYYWLANRGRRVMDANGEVRMLGTARVITAERNFAERLLRVNALLEEQIEERRQAQQRQAALIELGDTLRGQPDSGIIACATVRVLGSSLNVTQVVFVSIDPTGEHASLLASWTDGTTSSVKERFRLSDYGDLAYDLQRGDLVVIDDVEHDPRTAPITASLHAQGVHSLVAMPLMEQGRLRAVLLLLQAAPRDWPDEDASFIREIADRAWTADERMRAERALRESEEQFRTLADNMSQFAWMADPSGRIYWYNKRWYDYTGTTLEAMRALGWRSVLHPEHRERVLASMKRVFAIGSIWEETFPLRGKDGKYRWFLSRALPIRDDMGLVTHWFGTNTDITAQVAAEEALRELNDSLERRVGERTRELAEINHRLHIEMSERERAEEALRHAQKMEAIGQLTGGLAHDFNNMLTGVLGALDLIQRRAASGRVNELDRYIDAAVTSANRAAALTHRLLAFARRQSLDPRPVDINHLVVSMEDMLRRTIGEHIALTTRLEPQLRMAYSDAHQLENALLNLVINARDAMPSGGRLTIETRTLTVETTQPDGPEPGDYVVLAVSDTGTGMPEEVIAKAFDPFFTTKPIGQGTGLGLSMVYGFIKQTGGHVSIDSQVGEGTVITLYLPQHQDLPVEHDLQDDTADVPRAQVGETVLVVEDEAAVRMLVVEVLKELGYGALEAFDGPSALPYLESDRRIDLLVSDVGLPGMNGRQLAEIARQHRPDLKVLFITGYAPNAEVRGDFLEEGMEMLAKPFNIDVLGVRIRRMIEGEG